jgi:beta-phosphoglucomutase-like phosphatase (HAD superfamily)
MYIIFAEKYGFRKPTASELDIAIQLSPVQAVEDVFEWAREGNPVSNMVSALKGIYDLERSKLDVFKPTGPDVFSMDDARSSSENEEAEVVVVDGAISWIKALLDVEMPCGLVSYLDAEIVNLIMDKAGLTNLIPIDQRVSASSGYGRDAFQQLGASLRIDRRPDMCVVFDGNADALMAARDNEMKSIGMTSIYPSYELLAADTTARNFEYLTAMNIRRLFGERDNQEPLLQEYRQEPTRPSRPVMTMYPEDEKPHADDVVKDGYENDDYDDFNFDGARYYDDGSDKDRYYGDDKYKSKYSNKDMPPDGGVIYGDDESDSDLFQ